MATIKDVAKAARVSIATVSRVINNTDKVGEVNRSRVINAMNQLNYTPNANARALVKQKSSTIGVVVPDITDPFFASLANGVEEVARASKMQLLLSTGKQSEASELEAINLLIERRCEAIVAYSKLIPDDKLCLLSKKFPSLILIDRYIADIADRCIWLDNIEGGRIAARHLLSLNHQKLAVINSNYKIDDPLLRLTGFKQVVEKQNLTLPKNLVVSYEPTLKGGELAAQDLLEQKLSFTAVFAYNDAMAIGAISVFEDNGYKVPSDISIIGFDDVLLSQYSRPKLTTLHYPINKMATNAAKLAITYNAENIQQGFDFKNTPHLIKRDSTALKR
ncbi:LacI family DNA-binding transcriptional regulator [Shewanella gaetbuli]|uniref:LacI family DNA-binding transcriptional regulator n=1 Tax=Shewanella gaetbuli TaxID=220752 RepID=A0A9X1ZTY9_9GAMM|nr:LacI family DNA-binding transcriptional regulator [Shewanella gaetbuli]MCL1142176.1 LacI family DNA-binding transcriptional regulator [Shewanella gaetbuli]